MKKIFLMVILVVRLFGGENNNTDVPIMKHKTKIKNGIGTTKFIINSKKLGLNQHKYIGQGMLSEYSSDYVAHVLATIDNIPVFNAKLSPYLHSKLYFKFQFKDFTDSDDITFIVTDNHGKSNKQSFKINRDNILKNKNITVKKEGAKPIKINPKAWDALTIDSAIEAVYGVSKINIIETSFNNYDPDQITYPPGCRDKLCLIFPFNPTSTLIKSEIDVESIALFSTTTPKPLLAFIQIPENAIANIRIPLQLKENGKLFFIAKGKDGRLYRSESHNIEMIYYDTEDIGNRIYFNIKSK